MSDEPVSPVAQQQAIEEDDKPKTREEQEKQKAFDAFNEGNNKDKASMSVKVYSPSRVYYSGPAFSVSATNDTGEFDILPKHHPFISLLNACDVMVRTPSEGNHTIAISGGLVHVKADEVIVFLDI